MKEYYVGSIFKTLIGVPGSHFETLRGSMSPGSQAPESQGPGPTFTPCCPLAYGLLIMKFEINIVTF